MNALLFETRNLVFKRQGRTIFNSLSLQVPRGGVTALMGPSGVGKTTLLKLLTGQEMPDQGEVLFQGQDLSKMSRAELFKARQAMSFLFQHGALFTDLTLFENVAFPLEERGLSKGEIKPKVMALLQELNLGLSADLLPSELSGGMARRAAFARALISEPQVVLFDEPFTGQDPISKLALMELIRSLRTKDIAAVLVSHDIPETLTLADQTYVLGKEGKIVAQGDKTALSQNQDPQVSSFLDAARQTAMPF